MKALLNVIISFLFLSKFLFAQEFEKVSIELQWLNQFQFAGFYVAKEKGYYEEFGLDVEIKPYTGKTNLVSNVENQIATYATGKSSILIHQSKHKNLVVLDAIFEHSPSVLITTDPRMTHPYDLKNKRIMVTSDQSNATSFYAMLLSQGIVENDLIKQKHSFDVNDLINGKTDAMASYISNEPFLLRQKNIDFNVLNPKDYGYDFYGDLLYTSQKELMEHSERADKFVKASRKGWSEAFNDVNATAKLIFEKYNEQKKSLKSLVYEGNALKSFWCDNPKTGPVLSYKRFEQMSELYMYNNLISTKPDLLAFLDPLHFTRKKVIIGVLAKRGIGKAIDTWKPMLENMNFELSKYFISMRALSFEEIDLAVKEGSVDFVLTNSMQYVQLEAKYGTSRMATLLNDSPQGPISEYGAVIFTHVDNKEINALKDLKNKTFAAVNQVSFGGWIMAKKTLRDAGVKEEDFKSLKFLQTHDNVVQAVLDKALEAGTVRSDTLETLCEDGKIDLKKIKILNPLHYDNFGYLVSTELYPEWSFAKTADTDNGISSAILSILLQPDHFHRSNLPSWSIPLNYKPIHDLLKTLELEPYKPSPISYKNIFREYYMTIIIMVALMFTLLAFNSYLNIMVRKRTHELVQANEALKFLSQTDELTQIANRRQFFQMAQQYFNVAKRNDTPLALLYLDIDWFKNINDGYGHDVGDEVLKLFVRTIEKSLRKSDLFGRVGGEEFSILLQNSSDNDALITANKMRKSIEETPYVSNKNEIINFTVSIGISSLDREKNKFSDLIKSADNALYKAKERGRNRVVLN